MFVYRSRRPSFNLSINPSIHLSIYLSNYLSSPVSVILFFLPLLFYFFIELHIHKKLWTVDEASQFFFYIYSILTLDIPFGISICQCLCVFVRENGKGFNIFNLIEFQGKNFFFYIIFIRVDGNALSNQGKEVETFPPIKLMLVRNIQFKKQFCLFATCFYFIFEGRNEVALIIFSCLNTVISEKKCFPLKILLVCIKQRWEEIYSYSSLNSNAAAETSP